MFNNSRLEKSNKIMDYKKLKFNFHNINFIINDLK